MVARFPDTAHSKDGSRQHDQQRADNSKQQQGASGTCHIASTEILKDLLARAGADAKPEEFKRYGSARKLYNFDVDNAQAY